MANLCLVEKRKDTENRKSFFDKKYNFYFNFYSGAYMLVNDLSGKSMNDILFSTMSTLMNQMGVK